MTDTEVIDAILQREGGYVNHPADRGGPTNRGITLATLREWRGQPVTAADVQALTETEARAIYIDRYLRPFTDVHPEELRAQVVDIAVNSGLSTARLLLKRALLGQRPVAVQLVIERLAFYSRIVKARPSQAVFFEGWVRRACDFL